MTDSTDHDTDDPASCRTCNTPGFHPPHDPSRLCENNGTINHCTCSRCFGR